MEIEFNTSRIAKRDSIPPAAPRESAPLAANDASFPAASSLDGKLSDISSGRPDKIEQAKSLLVDPNYPPLELLDRIAHLLAVNVK